MRRPAKETTPGAAARFSLELSRALGAYPPRRSSGRQTGDVVSECYEQLRGPSDQPAKIKSYAPTLRRVKTILGSRRGGPEVRRPAQGGEATPGAVAVSSSFEPPRGADGRAWTPASTKTAIRDRLRRRSDSPARSSFYTPQIGGVNRNRRAPRITMCLEGRGPKVRRATEATSPRAVARFHFFCPPHRDPRGWDMRAALRAERPTRLGIVYPPTNRGVKQDRRAPRIGVSARDGAGQT